MCLLELNEYNDDVYLTCLTSKVDDSLDCDKRASAAWPNLRASRSRIHDMFGCGYLSKNLSIACACS